MRIHFFQHQGLRSLFIEASHAKGRGGNLQLSINWDINLNFNKLSKLRGHQAIVRIWSSESAVLCAYPLAMISSMKATWSEWYWEPLNIFFFCQFALLVASSLLLGTNIITLEGKRNLVMPINDFCLTFDHSQELSVFLREPVLIQYFA